MEEEQKFGLIDRREYIFMEGNAERVLPPGWSRKFMSTWLDDECLPSIEMMEGKGWASLTVADTLNPMEAEWLSDAISSTCADEILGVCFEFGSEPTVDFIDVNRDTLLEYNSLNNYKHVCITSLTLEFLYFKDQENRFFLLCGDIRFMEKVYKCSFETAKLMYFDYWVDSDFNSKGEKEFLTRVWGKYSALRLK